MSRGYGKKLRLIRKSEGLTQLSMAKIIGTAVSTIRNYETQEVDVGISIIDRVLGTKEFKKYTLWLMIDEVSPEYGQISPSLMYSSATTKIPNVRKTKQKHHKSIDAK